jgi:hypothetical protein
MTSEIIVARLAAALSRGITRLGFGLEIEDFDPKAAGSHSGEARRREGQAKIA